MKPTQPDPLAGLPLGLGGRSGKPHAARGVFAKVFKLSSAARFLIQAFFHFGLSSVSSLLPVSNTLILFSDKATTKMHFAENSFLARAVESS